MSLQNLLVEYNVTIIIYVSQLKQNSEKQRELRQ